MKRPLIALTCLLGALSTHMADASLILDNSEKIKEELKKQRLIVSGKLSHITPVALFDKKGKMVATNVADARKALPQAKHAWTIYTATLEPDDFIKNYSKLGDDPQKAFTITWIMLTNFKGTNEELLWGFCPPISPFAYRGEKRVFFLKWDHGTWRLDHDQRPQIASSIKQVQKTGSAPKLDKAFKQRQATNQDNDRFFDE